MRKGLLLAACVFAFAAPATHASPARASRITLGAIVVDSPAELDVPYALDTTQPGVAKLGVAIGIPSEPDFDFVGYYNPEPSGMLHVFWKRFDGGDVRVRVTAVAQDWTVLDTAEVATTVENWTVIGALTPSFGTQEVGTTERKRASRAEGTMALRRWTSGTCGSTATPTSSS